MAGQGRAAHEGVAFLAGQSKAGKSFLAIDVALRIAGGAKVLSRPTKQRGVVYIAAEDPEGCVGRCLAWKKAFKVDHDLPFDLMPDSLNLLDGQEVLSTIDIIEESVARFDEMDTQLGLIVIDTMARCLPGINENESQGMSLGFQALDRIGRHFDCLVLVVAHFGKAGEERGIRGWSGMDSNSDATITLERDKEDPELRTLTLYKVKNGRDGNQVSFRLEDVQLDMKDEDGEFLSSCVCAFEHASPLREVRKRLKKLNSSEAMVYKQIKAFTDNGKHIPIPPEIPGVLPHHKGLSKAAIWMKIWADGNFSLGAEKEDSIRRRFDRACQGLIVQERIRVVGDLLWLVA